ncbi:glutamate--tRNA ligase family protein [Neorhodopirellula lusitana]|uniref:glutamate--tRNA ligase family protein n=1 Tax=Neorhodopirellula lusitana TaxID=445327 RepID=UPI00384FEAC4
MTFPPVCRLAPSPTGAQHLGNARTFLIAYWSARSQNAKLILRIEDIDSPRVKPWAMQQAIDDLAWLGIEHDGDPIVQTQRVGHYEAVLQQMLKDDRVYPCVCSRKDIDEAASAPHEHSMSSMDVPHQNIVEDSQSNQPDMFVQAETTIYPGTCANWRAGDAMPPLGSYCLRFRTDLKPMILHDQIVGRVQCDPGIVLGDFPVTRKTGVAAYQLAVVVDDIDAGVTEVVRGDDLVASAFRQRQIYDYLGKTPPAYAHVSLVVGDDGRRLAKRHGDTRLSQYRDQGVAPESIVAWAASTTFGHRDDFPQSQVTRDWSLARWHQEMIHQFEWSAVSRQRTIVPHPSVNWFQ